MAFSLWTLFDLAELYTRLGKTELAEAYWQKFDAHRGTVFVKVWFPGILVMSCLYRAVAAQARNDRAAAYQYSGKVLDHWGHSAPKLQLVLDAANIHAVTKPI
jgi:hypothetical protein